MSSVPLHPHNSSSKNYIFGLLVLNIYTYIFFFDTITFVTVNDSFPLLDMIISCGRPWQALSRRVRITIGVSRASATTCVCPRFYKHTCFSSRNSPSEKRFMRRFFIVLVFYIFRSPRSFTAISHVGRYASAPKQRDANRFSVRINSATDFPRTRADRCKFRHGRQTRSRPLLSHTKPKTPKNSVKPSSHHRHRPWASEFRKPLEKLKVYKKINIAHILWTIKMLTEWNKLYVQLYTERKL